MSAGLMGYKNAWISRRMFAVLMSSAVLLNRKGVVKPKPCHSSVIGSDIFEGWVAFVIAVKMGHVIKRGKLVS